jgi:hypothetical protein
MPLTFPTLQENHWHYLLGCSIALLLWLWLRHELTPAKVLSIFETDGTLSARQILAWVLAFYGMLMRAAGRLDNDGMKMCFDCSFILFGIGGAVKVADKIKPPTTISAKTVTAEVKTDTTNIAPTETPAARPEYQRS